ncbi:beta-galactosidase, partial [bacterium]|nr:beta-galactosidase [bacterium]
MLKLKVFLLFIFALIILINDSIYSQPKLSPKPEWLQEGIIMAGNWEPLIFRTRRGHYLREDYIERYINEHSEETVKKLKNLGVNFVMTHAYKGFGLEAEKEDMKYAKQLAELCRKYGIRVGAYIGNTMMFETLFLEEPGAEEWIQRDENGKPVYYFADQKFRYKPNFFRKDFQEYMKKVIRTVIKELKPDLIHFDNMPLRKGSGSDHSSYTAELFRNYLKNKYSPVELKKRLRFPDVNEVRIPDFRSVSFKIVKNPLFQEWIDFRCHSHAEYYRTLSECIKEINPNIVVECNISGIYGTNRALNGINYSKMLIHGNAFWSEEPNKAKWTDDERLISKIRSYKLAALFDNVLFAYTSGHLLESKGDISTQLCIAEAFAYNRQTPGMVCWLEEDGPNINPESQVYLDYFIKNKEYYMHTNNIADVAVLQSHPSMAYNSGNPLFSTTLFHQFLIQKRILFDIIFDGHLEDLSKYKVLVLADQESMGDKELELVRKFVKNGGGLIAIGNSTLYTE